MVTKEEIKWAILDYFANGDERGEKYIHEAQDQNWDGGFRDILDSVINHGHCSEHEAELIALRLSL